jgi:hypothetical protein
MSTLNEMYNLFCQEAKKYQEFWKAMDELDSRCWVLEPENPSRQDTYRKIHVGMLFVTFYEHSYLFLFFFDFLFIFLIFCLI